MATFIIIAAVISLIVSGIQVFCFRKKIKDFIVKYTDTRVWKIYFLRIRYQKLLNKFDKLVENSLSNPSLALTIYDHFAKMSFGKVENFYFSNNILLTTEELQQLVRHLKHPKTTKTSHLVGSPLKILMIDEVKEYTYNPDKKSFSLTANYLVPSSLDLPWLRKNHPQCLNGEAIILEEFNKIK